MARWLTMALVSASLLVVVAVGSVPASAATSAVLVKDIVPGTGWSNTYPVPGGAIGVDRTLFFIADDGIHGSEPWKSDGTAEGTALVKDVHLGPDDSYPANLAELDGTIFFRADDGLHGEELWKTDGTAAGTSIVADINPGPGSSGPGKLFKFDGKLFFSANDGVHGREPWMTDGTAAGTRLLRDVLPATTGDGFGPGLEVDGNLFFTVADEGEKRETQLWMTDGTAAGTVFVTSIGCSLCERSTGFITAFGGLAIFFRSLGCCGDYALFRSDGTPEGTFYFDHRCCATGDLNVFNGALYYFHHPSSLGEGTADLWRSDATIEGSSQVTAITPDDPSDVSGATVVDERLLFLRFRGTGLWWDTPPTLSLWSSDGTAEGTRLAAEIGELYRGPRREFPPTPHFPGRPTRVGDALLFGAPIVGSGYELWATDATVAGTHLVKDIKPGIASALPEPLAVADGTLFFYADDGVNGRELWKTTPPLRSKPQRGDYKNASQYCKALLEFLGDSEFSQRYKNHGQCASASH